MVLQRWLGQKIHRWGRMFTPDHLAQRRDEARASTPNRSCPTWSGNMGELYKL